MYQKIGKLFALIFLLLTVNAEANEPVRVLLKWYHQFQFAGYYAAIKEGYYAKEGIDVELVEGGQEIAADAVPLVLGGEYDFGVASLSLFDAFYNELPVVVLAQIFQQNNYAFISNRTSSIMDFNALGGKRVVINRGAGEITFAFLEKMGISKNDIKLVEVLEPVHAMSNGAIDVFFSYTSTFPYSLMSNGIIPFELKPEDYGWNFVGDSLITHRNMIERRPDLVRKFVAATLKGWEYALDHQDEIINYTMGLKTKRPFRTSFEMLRAEAKKIEKYISRDLLAIGHIHQERWHNLFMKLCTYKGTDCQGRDLSSHFYVDNRDFRKYFNISTWGLVLLFSLVCVSLSFNLQLRRLVRKRTSQMKDEIDHRRLSEHELKMNDYAVSLALEGGGVAFFDIKAPFHQMKTNEQFALQLGHSAENFHETVEHWISNIHPEDQEHFVSLFNSSKRGKSSSFDCEARFAHASGKWKWLLCRGKVVEWDGDKQPKRILGTLLDINDLKHAADKANNAGKRHCALFSSMGHEIRTPLNCMMGFAELLLDENNAANRLAHVRQITQNGAQLLRVVSGLVDIAKTEFEGTRLRRSIFSPQSNLQKVFDTIKQRVAVRGVKIELTGLSSLPRSIKGEEQVISNVINYLCEHILKSMNSGELSVACNYAKTTSRKGHIQISFVSNGSDIRSEDFLQLFKGEWNSLDEWSSFNGRDFTLVVAKKLVDIMEGSFSLSTSQNGDNVFNVFFPVAEDDLDQACEQKTQVIDVAKSINLCRILVVDDDESSSILVRALIEKNGGVVESAREGLQAVKMLQEVSYDLIIMDIQMQGLDGIETTKIIRSRGISIPIVALSAHMIDQFERSAQEAGINGFLQKPISSQELFHAIAEYCPKKALET